MNKFLAVLLALPVLVSPAFAATYVENKDWVRLPEINGQPTNQHGDVAVASNGDIYVSTMDPKAGVQVFSPEGKLLRNVPGAPNDFHGFVIRKDPTGEYIYGPRLTEQTIVKLTLDGKVVLQIPASAIPDKFKRAVPANTKKDAKGVIAKNPDEGKRMLRMTGLDVAPNGDIYVTDGYATDFIHRFDRHGKYLSSFGGKEAPYNFKTLHKIAIDTRFSPARIIALDRANFRVLHLSLEGKLLGVVATDLRYPSAVAIQGDYAVIGELHGRVTLLDKQGKVVAHMGTNEVADEIGSNKAPPTVWRTGVVTSPHGVTFDARGNIFVSEYNTSGRVHRFVRQ